MSRSTLSQSEEFAIESPLPRPGEYILPYDCPCTHEQCFSNTPAYGELLSRFSGRPVPKLLPNPVPFPHFDRGVTVRRQPDPEELQGRVPLAKLVGNSLHRIVASGALHLIGAHLEVSDEDQIPVLRNGLEPVVEGLCYPPLFVLGPHFSHYRAYPSCPTRLILNHVASIEASNILRKCGIPTALGVSLDYEPDLVTYTLQLAGHADRPMPLCYNAQNLRLRHGKRSEEDVKFLVRRAEKLSVMLCLPIRLYVFGMSGKRFLQLANQSTSVEVVPIDSGIDLRLRGERN